MEEIIEDEGIGYAEDFEELEEDAHAEEMADDVVDEALDEDYTADNFEAVEQQEEDVEEELVAVTKKKGLKFEDGYYFLTVNYNRHAKTLIFAATPAMGDKTKKLNHVLSEAEINGFMAQSGRGCSHATGSAEWLEECSKIIKVCEPRCLHPISPNFGVYFIRKSDSEKARNLIS
jgi:hypothetical protein